MLLPLTMCRQVNGQVLEAHGLPCSCIGLIPALIASSPLGQTLEIPRKAFLAAVSPEFESPLPDGSVDDDPPLMSYLKAWRQESMIRGKYVQLFSLLTL